MTVRSTFDVRSFHSPEAYRASLAQLPLVPSLEERVHITEAASLLIKALGSTDAAITTRLFQACPLIASPKTEEVIEGVGLFRESIAALTDSAFLYIFDQLYFLSQGEERAALIENSDFRTSQDPFVRKLRTIADSGDFAPLNKNDVQVRRLAMELERLRLGPPDTFGFTTPSALMDQDGEEKLTAFIAREIENIKVGDSKPSNGGERKLRPLIVSVDQYYSHFTHVTSLAAKTDFFSRTTSQGLADSAACFDERGCRYAILLTGFSRSVLFDNVNLSLAPNVKAIMNRKNVFAERLHQLIFGEDLASLFRKHGDLAAVLESLIKKNDASGKPLIDRENAKLLLVTVLLAANINGWQHLWYEGSPERQGTPLFIVAPWIYHQAMIEVIEGSSAHGEGDYIDRAFTRSVEPLIPSTAPPTRRRPLSPQDFEIRTQGLFTA